MAQGNGGIIGPVKRNIRGKKVTSKTSSGNFNTQPWTTCQLIVAVGAGGGGG